MRALFAAPAIASALSQGTEMLVYRGEVPANLPLDLPTGSGFSTLNIATTTATPGGSYTLTITGIGGGVTNTTTLGLVVAGLGANLAWNSRWHHSGSSHFSRWWHG